MLITRNLELYAEACNLDPRSLLHHLQNDPFARQQFAAWKAEQARKEAQS